MNFVLNTYNIKTSKPHNIMLDLYLNKRNDKPMSEIQELSRTDVRNAMASTPILGLAAQNPQIYRKLKLQTLTVSAEGSYADGIYLYGIIMLCRGEGDIGQTYLDLLGLRGTTTKVDERWRRIFMVLSLQDFLFLNPKLVVEWYEAARNGPKGREFEPPPQIYPYAGSPGSTLLLLGWK